MNILFETEKLRIEHEYEEVFLIDKLAGKILLQDWFYGNPDCALIDKNNEWAIIAGEHITIWTTAKYQIITEEELRWVHSIRLKNLAIIEVLTDPWAENAAIWEINTTTFEFKKTKEFNAYKNKEYCDYVEW